MVRKSLRVFSVVVLLYTDGAYPLRQPRTLESIKLLFTHFNKMNFTWQSFQMRNFECGPMQKTEASIGFNAFFNGNNEREIETKMEKKFG